MLIEEVMKNTGTIIENTSAIIENASGIVETWGNGFILANKICGALGAFNPFKKRDTKNLNENKENDIIQNQDSKLNYLGNNNFINDIIEMKYRNLVETTKKVENLVKENNVDIDININKDIDWIMEWFQTAEGTSNSKKQNILANIFYYRIYQGIEYRKKTLNVIRYIEDKELDILYDISKYIVYLNEGPVIIRNLALKKHQRILEILKNQGLVDGLNDLYGVNSLGMVFLLDRYNVLYGFKNYSHHFFQLDTFVRLNELGYELFKNIRTEAYTTDFMDMCTELHNNINTQCSGYYKFAYRNVPINNYIDYYGNLNTQLVLANNNLVYDLENYNLL